MKTYYGKPNQSGCIVRVVSGLDPRPRELRPRLDLRNHSPTGFNWGYAGSGPAQLALALCADALGDDERAQRIYQKFKFAAVANWPQTLPWEIADEQVVKIVEGLERERGQQQVSA